jgi:hypothetical protein
MRRETRLQNKSFVRFKRSERDFVVVAVPTHKKNIRGCMLCDDLGNGILFIFFLTPITTPSSHIYRFLCGASTYINSHMQEIALL